MENKKTRSIFDKPDRETVTPELLKRAGLFVNQDFLNVWREGAGDKSNRERK